MQSEAESWGPRALKMVSDSLDLARTILKDLRTMSYLLHPPLLDEIGLESALRWFAQGFSERSGINVDLHLAPDMGRLSRQLETTVFRIEQESLTNIHRHSRSSSAIIRMSRDPRHVRLEVRDHGTGFLTTSSRVRAGVGIQGMQERVRQLQGEFEIRSDADGTVVMAVLPLQEPGEAKLDSNPVSDSRNSNDSEAFSDST
jgi:two-component system NarL family sensor kinase